MLVSLALILLIGLAMSALCQKLKLPGIIGMLVTGMVLGPFVLDLWIHPYFLFLLNLGRLL